MVAKGFIAQRHLVCYVVSPSLVVVGLSLVVAAGVGLVGVCVYRSKKNIHFGCMVFKLNIYFIETKRKRSASSTLMNNV